MKKAKQFVLLLSVLILCCICFPLSSSAAAPHYSVIPVQNEENGILTLENGEKWYKVRHFEDDADYLLTVKNDAGEQMILAVTNDIYTRCIWNYYRYTMTTSTAPRIAILTAGSYTLSADGSRLTTYYTGSADSDRYWTHEDSALCYSENGSALYLKYHADEDEPFSLTADRSEASEVTLYSRADTLERCITGQPAAKSYVTEDSGYAAPAFSVGLADVTTDSIQWFVDGEAQACSALQFTADSLTDQQAGVHRVSCLVEAHDSENVHYRERSADAAFVIAKGVVPDSILTFSDVHEEYGLITDAIEAVIAETDGWIPSLVICTGDLVNGPTVETERELNRYYPQILSQLGGLDTVFVAGNHDSAAAASVMSSAAGLGADAALSADGGVIFDGGSEAVLKTGTNSRYARGIITYGINFDAAIRNNADGILYSYEDTVRSVDRFLQETAAQYHGELVVISAHSGLHVIGMQPGSVSPAQIRLYPWLGENMYNVDCSYELAQTINRYAEQYHMNILYLFGHDHSRSETELFLSDGDKLTATRHYADRSSDSLTLHFTYAHAGYLSSVIGCADRNFAFIRRDGSEFCYDLMHVGDGVIRRRIFAEKQPYESPAPAETTAISDVSETNTAQTSAQTTVQTEPQTVPTASAPQTAAVSAVSAAKTAGVDAGENQNLLVIAVPAFIVLMISRKRKPKTS